MPITELQLVPVFAVDINLIVGIIVVLVSLIGWVVNLINENVKKQPQRPANQPGGGRQNEDRFQQEIDDFLKQVGGKPQERRHQDRPADVEMVDIEVVPERELWEREREERRNREISSLANRHVETNVGASIEDKVREDINVDADLGEANATAPVPKPNRPARVAPGDIVAMLRNPDGVRKAIIVNEVLRRRTPRR